MSAHGLRVLVLSSDDGQLHNISQLLAATDVLEPLARPLSALADLAGIDGHDARRNAAVAFLTDADVVVVAIDDFRVIDNAPALSAGVELLADIGVPVVLLLAFGQQTAADYSRASRWIGRHVRCVISIETPYNELLHAIRATAAGLVVLDPRVAQALTPGSARRRESMPVAARRSGQPLSPREREVLSLFAEGHATKTIARALGISTHTVKAHVESIFEKLGVTTRAEAVAVGVRRGDVML